MSELPIPLNCRTPPVPHPVGNANLHANSRRPGCRQHCLSMRTRRSTLWTKVTRMMRPIRSLAAAEANGLTPNPLPSASFNAQPQLPRLCADLPGPGESAFYSLPSDTRPSPRLREPLDDTGLPLRPDCWHRLGLRHVSPSVHQFLSLPGCKTASIHRESLADTPKHDVETRLPGCRVAERHSVSGPAVVAGASLSSLAIRNRHAYVGQRETRV